MHWFFWQSQLISCILKASGVSRHLEPHDSRKSPVKRTQGCLACWGVPQSPGERWRNTNSTCNREHSLPRKCCLYLLHWQCTTIIWHFQNDISNTSKDKNEQPHRKNWATIRSLTTYFVTSLAVNTSTINLIPNRNPYSNISRSEITLTSIK